MPLYIVDYHRLEPVELYVFASSLIRKGSDSCELVPFRSFSSSEGRGTAENRRSHRLSTYLPVWDGSFDGDSALRSSYLCALDFAHRNGLSTVALELFGTGGFNYPKHAIMSAALCAVREFLSENELTVYLVAKREDFSFSPEYKSKLLEAVYECDEIEKSRGIFPKEKDAEENYSCLGEDACFSASADSAECEPPSFSRACARSMPPLGRRARPEAIDYSECSVLDAVKTMDKSFCEVLFGFIDEKGMTDVECYKRANVDKRVFSKIKSNPSYHPSRTTALAFAVALRLTIEETARLLLPAGYALSRSTVFDATVYYFIENGIYDVFEINEALYEFDQPLLGSA